MSKKSNILTVVLLLMAQLTVLAQKVVRHDLYVRDTIVNYAGKSKRAIAVNGQIPMPTLTFTEGDTAEIVVHNELKENFATLAWYFSAEQRRRCATPDARTYKGEFDLYLSFSDNSTRYTLVSFALGPTGTDRYVW